MAGEQLNNAMTLKQLIADQNRLLTEQIRIEDDRLKIQKGELGIQNDISNVIRDQTKLLTFQRAERSAILRSTNSISKIQEQLSVMDRKELGTKKALNKLKGDSLKVEKNISLLQLTRSGILKDQTSLTKKQIEANTILVGSIDDQIESALKLNLALQETQNLSQVLSNNFGVKAFNNLSEAVKSIPGLSAFSAPFEAASEASLKTSQDIENSLKTGKGLTQDMVKRLGLEDKLKSKSGKTLSGTAAASKFDKLGAPDGKKLLGVIDRKGFMSAMSGIKSLGKSLTTALAPAVMLAELLKAFIQGDKAAGDMAKSMNITYKAALSTRRELREMATASFDNFVTTKGMQESLLAINGSLGTGVMASQEMLTQFTQMRERAGLTNEEIQGISSISLATGESMNDITGEFMAQAKLSATQNGVLLNEKSLLKDIGKVSAATTLSFGKNPKLIAEAVATAKSLGMELSQVDAIASSLLDFESSISNELEAELLLNKDLNLEKARQYALNNDLAGVAREISEQAGSSAEYGEMNRIQQEALAKSVGMSREDLAKTLYVQEQLVGLTGERAKEEEDAINRSIEAIGLEQTQKKLKDGSIQNLMDQNSQADKLAATISKVQELFVAIAEPILVLTDALTPVLDLVGGIVSGFMMVASYIGEGIGMVGNLADSLGPIKYILKGIAGVAIVLTSMLAYGALAGIPVIGPVLGAAAAALILTKGFSTLAGADKAGDMNSPADGKTQVSTKEGGLFELSKNDDLIAAPGASKMMQGGQSTQTVQNNTVVENKTDMSATNALLAQLIKKTPEMAPLGMYEVQ